MIVLRRNNRLLLITQLDHASVAGCLAENWGNSLFAQPDPVASVILAAGRHDEGWREWDDDIHLDPTGRAPLHFRDVDIADYVDLYARGITRIAEIDTYAGLLVSMHGTGNVCGRWGNQPGIRLSRYDYATSPDLIERYVLEQEALQARLKLKILGLNPVDQRSEFERRLWSNFDLLQAWDRLSLFLCHSDYQALPEIDLGLVPTSVTNNAAPTKMKARTSVDHCVALAPWPFKTNQLKVVIPFREIPDRVYKSHSDLREEATTAEIRTIKVSLIANEQA